MSFFLDIVKLFNSFFGVLQHKQTAIMSIIAFSSIAHHTWYDVNSSNGYHLLSKTLSPAEKNTPNVSKTPWINNY